MNPESHTQLSGRPLILARLAWSVIVLLVILILSELVPINASMTYSEWLVTQARPALPDFITYWGFVRYLTVLESAVALLSIMMGLAVFRYKSDDLMGLFVSAVLVMISLLAISGNIDTWRFPSWLPWPQSSSYLFAFVVMNSFLLFFYLFPNGRFVPRWTRWTALPGLLAVGAFTLPQLFFSWEVLESVSSGEEELGWLLFISLFLFSICAAVFAQVYRYRSVADPVHKQQMKWVIFGLGVWLSNLIWLWLTGLLLPEGWDAFIGTQLDLFALALLPIALGISILRYRLWDVDIIINRTLVYGGLTLLIVSIYVMIVGGFSTLFQTQTTLGTNLLALAVIGFVAPALYRRWNSSVSRLVRTSSPASDSFDAREGELENAPDKGTTLHGRPLLLARVAWIGSVLLALFLFVVSTQMAQEEGWFDRIPALATQVDVLLFQVFANNTFFSGATVFKIAFIQFAAFSVVGLLLFWRRSNDWLVMLASTMLVTTGVGFYSPVLFLPVLQPNWHIPVTLLQIILFSTLIAFLYLFPSGRFTPAWTGYSLIAWLLFSATWLFVPEANPHRGSSMVALLIFIAWTWSGLAVQAYRFRHVATPVNRQQVKWVVFGFLTTQATFSLLVLPAVLGVTPRLEAIAPFPIHLINALFGLSAVFIPITIGVAILRYRLWDINLIINRTLVYGGLTAIIVLAYVVVVGVLSLLLQPGDSVLLSVVVTGLIAILFSPLRQRLQQGVNRLMYGERDDPVTVLSRLGERLEKTAASAEVLTALVETVVQVLKLPYAAVALRDGDDFPIVAEHPVSAGRRRQETLVLPLVYRSEMVGQLLVASRSENEPLTPADRRLLENIARQAGTAVHAAQLTTRLQRSRERLVTAREEERRRLRRDLHDGLGPQLATLALKTDAASNQLRKDPDTTERLLIELKSQIQDAIQDIRRLVYDLRPPALDQLGLVSALEEYAASQNGHHNLHISVEAREQLPPLPAAVEVAAYRIALEALTNVIRHADAGVCSVSLEYYETRLQLSVRDDGSGLPALYEAGVGLTSMRERVSELGGSLVLENNPTGGTRLQVQLPLNQMESDS